MLWLWEKAFPMAGPKPLLTLKTFFGIHDRLESCACVLPWRSLWTSCFLFPQKRPGGYRLLICWNLWGFFFLCVWHVCWWWSCHSLTLETCWNCWSARCRSSHTFKWKWLNIEMTLLRAVFTFTRATWASGLDFIALAKVSFRSANGKQSRSRSTQPVQSKQLSI